MLSGDSASRMRHSAIGAMSPALVIDPAQLGCEAFQVGDFSLDVFEVRRRYGIGLKLFGFIRERVCSPSSRNTVRNHPGIAFILPRIPQTRSEYLNARAVCPKLDFSLDYFGARQK
ncbi:MAG: hypothetical protein ACRD5L_16035 [Bryobacteraceae bacterium]